MDKLDKCITQFEEEHEDIEVKRKDDRLLIITKKALKNDKKIGYPIRFFRLDKLDESMIMNLLKKGYYSMQLKQELK